MIPHLSFFIPVHDPSTQDLETWQTFTAEWPFTSSPAKTSKGYNGAQNEILDKMSLDYLLIKEKGKILKAALYIHAQYIHYKHVTGLDNEHVNLLLKSMDVLPLNWRGLWCRYQLRLQKISYHITFPDLHDDAKHSIVSLERTDNKAVAQCTYDSQQ